MPKWGNINERRNQLHEVIRLSGMNLIINDTDHPLIIKVASIQSARMQVYFIDNDDYFMRRQMMTDENGVEYTDNDERAVFYARGVLETVKKLRWVPDIVHCHGWMTSVVPFYIKTACRDEPSFRDSKIVYSLYEECFKTPIAEGFPSRVALKGTNNVDKNQLRGIDSCMELQKMALRFSDGVIVNSEKAPEELVAYAKDLNLPMLGLQKPEDYAEACSQFYDKVWG